MFFIDCVNSSVGKYVGAGLLFSCLPFYVLVSQGIPVDFDHTPCSVL